MVQPVRPQRPPRTARFTLTAGASAALLALGLGTAAHAQATDTPAPQRVEVTGSAIKRIDGETALPVQVISREEIVKAGLTTASEIISRLSASAGNLTDGASIASGGSRDQMGFNGANLRGIGVSSTLVLLNGRRMANFASPGDDAGVDLNTIPAAAIERVEVLLDGASALYGSDAIGGVINFITRRDYQGVEVNASVGVTGEGGAGKRIASVSAGYGDYGRDGFNVMGVLDLQKTDRLASPQRKFITDLNIPGRLPYLLLSRTFPANVDLTDEQLALLQAGGFKIGGKLIDQNRINFSAPDCNPPANLHLPDGIGGSQGCTYNFMQDVELYPKSDKLSLFGRGVLDVGAGHQLFAEASVARSKTYYVALPAPFTVDIDLSKTPITQLQGYGLETLDDPTIRARLRMVEAGRQSSELVSTGQRYVAGASGTLANWDYEVALNHSTSTVSDRAAHGYLDQTMMEDGIASGVINAFGPSGAAGIALINAAQITGEMRRSTGTMDGVDFKFSRGLTHLPGGDLGLAVGGEFRRERQDYHQSQALADDLILGETSQGPDQDFSFSRKVAALWTELSAPVTKALELQFAIRHERYQGTGSATSPKIGLRYQPEKEWLLRASAGGGFRAPSMTDLYRPVVEFDGPLLVDPDCSGSVTDCSDTWRVRRFSNPDLKPEKSRQFSLGVVFEPSKQFSASVDYWNIRKTNLISTIGAELILANEAKYGNLVHRYEDDGSIEYIELRKENRGAQKISGLDLMANWRGLQTAVGTFGTRVNATWTLSSKEQTGNGDPFVSNLGKFVNDHVVQRWRHTISVDWEQGPWSATLSNSFLSSYTDQNNAPDLVTGTYVSPNTVKAYSIWDLTGAWEVSKALTLRGGIKNLLDTPPPYSNQAYYYLSGYDPSYTDPRGRFFYLSAQYKFK